MDQYFRLAAVVALMLVSTGFCISYVIELTAGYHGFQGKAWLMQYELDIELQNGMQQPEIPFQQ